MKFRTTILQGGKTATGIRIPDDVMATLASGRKPPVRLTINGHAFRSTVATVDGQPMVGVSAETREAAGVRGGDEVEVELELDTAPRELVVPADLSAALDASPEARRTFDGLSYSNRQWHVLQATGTNNEETRRRRIGKSVAALREGRIR